MTTWPEFSHIESGTNNHLTLVNAYAVLEVKGADSVKFLQGQCSADMEALAPNNALAGAICTVQGRVVTTFIALPKEDSILLVMPRGLVATTVEYLKKYAAFYKVELIQWLHPSIIANTHFADFSEDLYLPCHFQLGDNDFHLGILSQLQSDQLISMLQSNEPGSPALGNEANWLDHLMLSGWIYLDRQLSEQYLPHQLNLDQVGALNFKKGCYTGQEIIARMEYRGKTKKRLKAIQLTGALPQRGTLPAEIKSTEDQSLGELLQLSSSTSNGLALLPVDLPAEGSFLCDGQTLNYQELT